MSCLLTVHSRILDTVQLAICAHVGYHYTVSWVKDPSILSQLVWCVLQIYNWTDMHWCDVQVSWGEPFFISQVDTDQLISLACTSHWGTYGYAFLFCIVTEVTVAPKQSYSNAIVTRCGFIIGLCVWNNRINVYLYSMLIWRTWKRK